MEGEKQEFCTIRPFSYILGNMYCTNCGHEIGREDNYCSYCGIGIKEGSTPKSQVAAGLLAFFLGFFGIHNFYLGYKGKAIAQLLITISGFLILIVGIATFDIAVMLTMTAATIVLWLSVWVWAIIESILVFAGKICSYNGDELR